MYVKDGTGATVAKKDVPNQEAFVGFEMAFTIKSSGNYSIGFYADAIGGDWAVFDVAELGYLGASQADPTPSPQPSNPGGTSSGSDGTKTETTRNPDGSKTVVTKKPDGTVITVDTAANGDKVEKVENKDGSSQTKMETSIGTSVTTVDADGKTQAKVELPVKTVEAAVQNHQAVTLPMPAIAVAQDTENAATVTISVPKDAAVKAKIPVEKPTAGTVAVLVHPDGTEEILRTSAPTSDGIILSITGNMTVKVIDNSKPFEDVNDSHWAKDSVAFVTSRELFRGTGKSTFSPQATMTRSMLATVLFRLDGEKAGQVKHDFNDVTDNTWYADAVAWAADTGVVQGVGNDNFAPNSEISREALCTMIYRYAKLIGAEGQPGSVNEFLDAGSVAEWASEAVQWCIGSGLVGGKGNGVLDPKGTATRAEVAAVLERLVTLIQK